MTPLDVGRFAITALIRHRRRSFLCLLGVSVGVAAVVLLTGLGEGARRYVREQFSNLGTNLLIVVPGRTETTGAIPGIGGVPNDLTLDDTRALERALTSARRIAPVSMGTETVAHGARRRQTLVIGATPELKEVRRLGVSEGRFLPESDLERGASVAVLGRKIVTELFGNENPVGSTVRIGDFRVRVIGVLESRGVQLGFDMDDAVIVPVATGMRIFDRSSLFRILIELESHASLERAKERIRGVIIDRHDEEDVTLITQDSVVSSLSAILGALTAALAGIGAISLAVAGIGIMNVMLVSVAERTREIGLLKALGARRNQILALFLTEAVLISSTGGLLGLLVSLSLLRLVTHLYPALPAAAPLWAVTAALLVSMVTGAVFGLAPAWRAAGLDPVASLTRR